MQTTFIGMQTVSIMRRWSQWCLQVSWWRVCGHAHAGGGLGEAAKPIDGYWKRVHLLSKPSIPLRGLLKPWLGRHLLLLPGSMHWVTQLLRCNQNWSWTLPMLEALNFCKSAGPTAEIVTKTWLLYVFLTEQNISWNHFTHNSRRILALFGPLLGNFFFLFHVS